MTTNQFGRVDDENNVFVVEKSGERRVGQYPNVSKEEALAFYVNKFADLDAQVRILEQRVASKVDTHLLKKAAAKLTEDLAEPNAVGDLDNLRQRVAAIMPQLETLSAEQKQQSAAVVEVSLAKREQIAAKAEKIASTDLAKIQWKTTSAEFVQLFEQWQNEQKNGPRVSKSLTDPIWKRFSAARTKFDIAKRAHFAGLSAANKASKSNKLELIKRAEKLAAAGDATSADFKKLMDEWKLSGKSNGKGDDELWAQFKAFGDAIYTARQEQIAVENKEFAANLEVKLTLLKEAQQIDPTKDLTAAKAALLSIQQRWEKAGKVPRDKVREVEDKLRAVEAKVKDAEQELWRKTDPATQARTNSVVEQLEQSILKLESDLAAATAGKDAKKIQEAKDALAARKSWLEVVLASAK